MKGSVNKYTAPTYYRQFGSIRLSKEELLNIMIEDSERLKKNGVSYGIRLEDYSVYGSGVHVASIYRNNFTPYHDHDYYELNYVFSGELLEYIDGRALTLESGDMLIMAPNVRHVSNPYKKARCYNILISTGFAENAAAQLARFDGQNYLSELIKTSGFLIFHQVRVESLVSNMNDLARRERKNFKYRVPLLECLGKQLLFALCNHSYDVYVRVEKMSRNLTEELVAGQILDYIRKHIDSVSLPRLSQYFGYSQSQIGRLIEKYSGGNYTEFVVFCRQRKAERLLRRTTLPVFQIAAETGFKNTESFCRWFKHYFCATPSEFRKKSKPLENTGSLQEDRGAEESAFLPTLERKETHSVLFPQAPEFPEI